MWIIYLYKSRRIFHLVSLRFPLKSENIYSLAPTPPPSPPSHLRLPPLQCWMALPRATQGQQAGPRMRELRAGGGGGTLREKGHLKCPFGLKHEVGGESILIIWKLGRGRMSPALPDTSQERCCVPDAEAVPSKPCQSSPSHASPFRGPLPGRGGP